MLKRTLYLSLLLWGFSLTTTYAQDSDGDGVVDALDVDDDNDGILDVDDCQYVIPNFSFESPTGPPYYIPADDWTVIAPNGHGFHDIQPANNYPAAAEGNQFLFLNTNDGVTATATTTNPVGVFHEGSIILKVAVGDGINNTNAFRNDNETILELGYDDGLGNFVSVANRVIDGTVETIPGTWTDFDLSLNLTPADTAILGQGILIRITHTGGLGTQAGNYDNVRLEMDSDGDGISNCFELDSDNDGVSDILEAGYNNDDTNNDGLADGAILANGSVILTSTYIGNSDTSFDVNKDGSIFLDNDGDLVHDYTDLDDDNDGISDFSECQVSVANYSFETNAVNAIDNWSLINTGPSYVSWGIETPTSNYFNVPDGNSHAFINGEATMRVNFGGAEFEPGNLNISIEVGDGLPDSDIFANDGNSTVTVGYLEGGGCLCINIYQLVCSNGVSWI